MKIIYSTKELTQWVRDHVGSDIDDEDVDKIVRAIHQDSKSPLYGENWESYLDNLPDFLIDLIKN